MRSKRDSKLNRTAMGCNDQSSMQFCLAMRGERVIPLLLCETKILVSRRDQSWAASRWAAGGIRGGGPARGVRVQLRPAAEAAADERLRAGARVQQGCDNRGRMREDGGHWPAGAGQQWRRAWLMRPRGHRRIAPCGPASASDCARTSACRRGAGGLPPPAYAGWVGSRAQVPLRRLG